MSTTPMPARLGRYEILRELGKGAMGIVYEGRDPQLNRRVAIKTARKDVMEATGMGEEMMQRFVREAQASGALEHPNIITIYDAGEEGDVSWIAMEYLEGGDLRDVIERRRTMTPAEIAETGAIICEALARAHEQGIIHRDIKPANIMTPKDKPLKLADFGIAYVADSNLTQDGALVGTPHYMSPEQFMGHRLDGRSDLFSVGVMLYELLTEEKPFEGDALTTVMHNVIKTIPTDPREINPQVNPHLSRVVMKSIAKRPQDRYQTAAQMAQALRETILPQPDPTRMGFLPKDFDTHATPAPNPHEELPGTDSILDFIATLPTPTEPDTLIPEDTPPTPPPTTTPAPQEPDTINLHTTKSPLSLPMAAGIAAIALALIALGWLLAGWWG